MRRAGIFVALLFSAMVASAQTGAGKCVDDDHTLCLRDNRFSVTAFFQSNPTGPSLPANRVALTDDSGYFWFFDVSNAEIVVKVLDACYAPYFAYWFFAAGLTDVGVHITVTDTLREQFKQYDNPVGTPFEPIQDTGALPTCP